MGSHITVGLGRIRYKHNKLQPALREKVWARGVPDLLHLNTGLGFRVWGLWFRVWGLGFMYRGSVFRV